MGEIPTLRFKVGVCGCTLLYHKTITNRQFALESLGGTVLKTPRILLFEDVPIPGVYHAKSLKQEGCQFFVDVVRWTMTKTSVRVELNQAHLTKTQKYLLRTGAGWGYAESHYWNPDQDEPPSTEWVLDAALSLLNRRCPTERMLDKWLNDWAAMMQQINGSAA